MELFALISLALLTGVVLLGRPRAEQVRTRNRFFKQDPVGRSAMRYLMTEAPRGIPILVRLSTGRSVWLRRQKDDPDFDRYVLFDENGPQVISVSLLEDE